MARAMFSAVRTFSSILSPFNAIRPLAVSQAGKFHTIINTDEVLKTLKLDKKKCLVADGTGAIGLQVAKSLVKYGAKVTMTSDNMYLANSIIKKNESFHGKANVIPLNLNSLNSVKKCSEKLLAEERKFDIVVLSGHVADSPYVTTEDNIERIFQVNHLSQFYLALSLEPILAPNARVVFLSSVSHKNVNKDFEGIISTGAILKQNMSEYCPQKAFDISMLCNILAATYLREKWTNLPITAFAACPDTLPDIFPYTNYAPVKKALRNLSEIIVKPDESVTTPVFCASALEVMKESIFYVKCKPREASAMATDSKLAGCVFENCVQAIKNCVPKGLTELEKPFISDYSPQYERISVSC